MEGGIVSVSNEPYWGGSGGPIEVGTTTDGKNANWGRLGRVVQGGTCGGKEPNWGGLGDVGTRASKQANRCGPRWLVECKTAWRGKERKWGHKERRQWGRTSRQRRMGLWANCGRRERRRSLRIWVKRRYPFAEVGWGRGIGMWGQGLYCRPSQGYPKRCPV